MTPEQRDENQHEIDRLVRGRKMFKIYFNLKQFQFKESDSL